MAVTNTRVDSDLIVGVKTGTKLSGGDEIKNFRFSKIKIDASDDAIHAVGVKIASVLPYPTKYIQRVNENILLNE